MNEERREEPSSVDLDAADAGSRFKLFVVAGVAILHIIVVIVFMIVAMR